ncbi:retrovirus-related Pol polyprotein [Gracilaria domingensis]|nr:retrovirus-related Pol polyprotein [Gracilaria domingensis]
MENISSRGDTVEVGDGKRIPVYGKEDIPVTTVVHEERKSLILSNVQFVPDLKFNLLSVSSIRRKSFFVVFKSDDLYLRNTCLVTDPRTAEIHLLGLECVHFGLYEAVLKTKGSIGRVLISRSNVQNCLLWHRRLKHGCEDHLRKNASLVDGMNAEHVLDGENCDNCNISKSTRDSRPASLDNRAARELGDLAHSDVVGLIRAQSVGGARYYVTLYQDKSCYSMVKFLRRRSEVPNAVRKMISELETLLEKRLKGIRFDNANEYLSGDLQNWLRERDTTTEPVAPYSPESNKRAERLNCTLNDAARTMLLSISHFPERSSLWAEAVITANYLINIMYTSASTEDCTPYEAVFGTRPNVSHVRIFGALAYDHIPMNKQKGKFEPKAQKGILVGFEKGNSYRIFYPDSLTFSVSRDVQFDEITLGWQPNPTAEESIDLSELWRKQG